MQERRNWEVFILQPFPLPISSPAGWVMPCTSGWATSLYDWRENKSLSLTASSCKHRLPSRRAADQLLSLLCWRMLGHCASCWGLVNPLVLQQCLTKPCVPSCRCAVCLNIFPFCRSFKSTPAFKQMLRWHQWITLKIIELILSLMCWKAK